MDIKAAILAAAGDAFDAYERSRNETIAKSVKEGSQQMRERLRGLSLAADGTRNDQAGVNAKVEAAVEALDKTARSILARLAALESAPGREPKVEPEPTPTHVWVVTYGSDRSTYIKGVYDTPDLANAAYDSLLNRGHEFTRITEHEVQAT